VHSFVLAAWMRSSWRKQILHQLTKRYAAETRKLYRCLVLVLKMCILVIIFLCLSWLDRSPCQTLLQKLRKSSNQSWMHTVRWILGFEIDHLLPFSFMLLLTNSLQGDVETLKKYCSKEVIERCTAERTAYQTHGVLFDNKVRFSFLVLPRDQVM